MISELEDFYLNKEEPLKSTLLALRTIVKNYDPDSLMEMWKYKLPFFYYKGKMFCYLWKNKKTQQPYLGIANAHLFEHQALVQGDRKRMKVFPIDTNKDISVDIIYEVFDLAVETYK